MKLQSQQQEAIQEFEGLFSYQAIEVVETGLQLQKNEIRWNL